ncbi:MAG: FtsW/RodA/SpoVE family cell cycle protein [Bdellovibrionota bacterium]
MKQRISYRDKNLKTPFLLEPAIVILVMVLSFFGLIMIYSTKSVTDSENLYFFKQLNAVIVGIVLMFLVSRVKIRFLYKISKSMLPLLIIFMLLPLIPGIGSDAGGAQRWAKIGFFRFQPGEFVKIFFIIYLAGYYARHEDKIEEFLGGLINPLLLISLVGGLFLLQPDLGSAIIVVGASLTVAFAVGGFFKVFFVRCHIVWCSRSFCYYFCSL